LSAPERIATSTVSGNPIRDKFDAVF